MGIMVVYVTYIFLVFFKQNPFTLNKLFFKSSLLALEYCVGFVNKNFLIIESFKFLENNDLEMGIFGKPYQSKTRTQSLLGGGKETQRIMGRDYGIITIPTILCAYTICVCIS